MSLFAGYRVSIHGDPRWAVKITDWGRSSWWYRFSRGDTPRLSRQPWEMGILCPPPVSCSRHFWRSVSSSLGVASVVWSLRREAYRERHMYRRFICLRFCFVLLWMCVERLEKVIVPVFNFIREFNFNSFDIYRVLQRVIFANIFLIDVGKDYKVYA